MPKMSECFTAAFHFISFRAQDVISTNQYPYPTPPPLSLPLISPLLLSSIRILFLYFYLSPCLFPLFVIFILSSLLYFIFFSLSFHLPFFSFHVTPQVLFLSLFLFYSFYRPRFPFPSFSPLPCYIYPFLYCPLLSPSSSSSTIFYNSLSLSPSPPLLSITLPSYLSSFLPSLSPPFT